MSEENKWAGIPMTEEEKKEVEKDFRIMQESMEQILEEGEDL